MMMNRMRNEESASSLEDAAYESGYSTDQEETEEQTSADSEVSLTPESEGGLATSRVGSDGNNISGSSDKLSALRSSPDLSYDSSDDSLAWHHEYLTKKCRLLKRACDCLQQEETYDAAMAQTFATLKTREDSALLRQEVKNIFLELFGDHDVNFPSRTRVRPNKKSRHIDPRPKALETIDLSVVNHSSSKAFDDSTSRFPFLNTLYRDSCWMARTLNQTRAEQTSDKCSGDRGDRLGAQSPDLPQHLAGTHSIAWDQALVISGIAQLLAQGVTPFVIVHANKAFYEFSGFAPEHIMGHPIESVLKISENSVTSDSSSYKKKNESNQLMMAHLQQPQSLSSSSSGAKRRILCQIQVISVVDSSRPDGSSSASFSPVTHVLVKVYSTHETELQDLPQMGDQQFLDRALIGIG